MNTDTLVLVVARHSSKSVFPGLKCFSSFLDFIFAWLTCVGTEWLFDMCSNVIFQTLHRSELQLMAHLIGYWGGNDVAKKCRLSLVLVGLHNRQWPMTNTHLAWEPMTRWLPDKKDRRVPTTTDVFLQYHLGSYRIQGYFWRFPIYRNATLTRWSSTTRHTGHMVTLKNRDWGNMSWFLLRYSFLRVAWLFLTSRFFPFLASLRSFFLLPWGCWD